MAFVVTNACVLCEKRNCVKACTEECFHEGPNMMAIDRKSCINCGFCAEDCPAAAIVEDMYSNVDVIEINKEMCKKYDCVS